MIQLDCPNMIKGQCSKRPCTCKPLAVQPVAPIQGIQPRTLAQVKAADKTQPAAKKPCNCGGRKNAAQPNNNLPEPQALG